MSKQCCKIGIYLALARFVCTLLAFGTLSSISLLLTIVRGMVIVLLHIISFINFSLSSSHFCVLEDLSGTRAILASSIGSCAVLVSQCRLCLVKSSSTTLSYMLRNNVAIQPNIPALVLQLRISE